jgi:hypothetical protein
MPRRKLIDHRVDLSFPVRSRRLSASPLHSPCCSA